MKGVGRVAMIGLTRPQKNASAQLRLRQGAALMKHSEYGSCRGVHRQHLRERVSEETIRRGEGELRLMRKTLVE